MALPTSVLASPFGKCLVTHSSMAAASWTAGNPARCAYRFPASASRIAATHDVLRPHLHTVAGGGHTGMGADCGALERILFFFHGSVMILGYTHPDKSRKVSCISSVLVKTQPFAIL